MGSLGRSRLGRRKQLKLLNESPQILSDRLLELSGD